jgi:hypothetical protein
MSEKLVTMMSPYDEPRPLKPYPRAIREYITYTGDHPFMLAFAIFAAIAEYRSWPPAEDPAGAQYERMRQHWPTPIAWVRKFLSAESDAEALTGVVWAHSYLNWIYRYSAMDPSAALWTPTVTPPAEDHHPESHPTAALIDPIEPVIGESAESFAARQARERAQRDPAAE